MNVSPVERRKAENLSLSRLIDRVVHTRCTAGYDSARFLLAANQVPSTIGLRILFDDTRRRQDQYSGS